MPRSCSTGFDGSEGDYESPSRPSTSTCRDDADGDDVLDAVLEADDVPRVGARTQIEAALSED